MKILHVTECMNAGVEQAIFHLSNKFKDDEHHLLWDSHNDAPTNFQRIQDFFGANASHWQGGWTRKFFFYQKEVSTKRPDVIHVHSSKAGVVTRILPRKSTLIYSPHCYAFERQDISLSFRRFIWFIENLLNLNTSAISVNWPIEYHAAQKMLIKRKVFFVPLVTFNTTNQYVNPVPTNCDFLSIGRLRPQKDPAFFSDVAQLIPSAKFLWVGGSELELNNEIKNVSFNISKWMPTKMLEDCIQKSLATLITSKWESGPLTLFESLNQGTPVVVRASSYSRLLGIDTWDSPKAMAEECLNIMNSSRYRSDLLKIQIDKIRDTFEKYEELGRYSSYSEAVYLIGKKSLW